MSEKNDYFDYVTQVLGVKSIFDDPHSVANNQSFPLLIGVENYLTYTENEKDLLFKMISALKIDEQKIRITDLREIHTCKAEFYIYLVEEKNEINSTALNLVQTYSPRFLLKNSDYKKQAWSDLQKVIAFFK